MTYKIGSTRTSAYLPQFFRIVGLWFTEQSTIAYKIYSYVFHFVFSAMYTASMLVHLALAPDIDTFVHAFQMTFTVVAMFIKIMNFYRHNQLIQQCFRQVAQFRMFSRKEVAFARRQHHLFLLAASTFYSVCNITNAILYVQVLFADEPRLSFSGWYPLDWQHNRAHYWTVYGYQNFGMFVATNLNVSLDVLPSYILFMTSANLEILGKRWRKIRNVRRCMAELRDCIKAHTSILEYIKSIRIYF